MSAVPIWVWYVLVAAIWATLYLRPEVRRMRKRARARRVCRVQGGILPKLDLRIVSDENPHPWCRAQARRWEALGFTAIGAFREDGTSARWIAWNHPEGFVATAKVGGIERRTNSVTVHLHGDRTCVVMSLRSDRGAVYPAWLRVSIRPNAAPAALLAALRTEIAGPAWAEARMRDLETVGFVRLGAFAAEGSTHRGIASLHPDGFLAEATVGGTGGRNMILFALTTGGETFSVTTTPPPREGFAHPAWSHVRYLPRPNPATLLAALRVDLAGREVSRIAPETYVAVDAAERRRMNEWVLVHGPLRPEMVPNLEAISGLKADPVSLALLQSAHGPRGIYPHE